MILQALVEYYYRKSADPDANMAPPGFENKEIPFLIILNEHGEFIDLQDNRERKGKKLIGKKYRIPQTRKRSGTNASPNYLWDNLSYVFGIESSGQEALHKGNRKKEAFLKNLKDLYPEVKNNPEIQAVIDFLESNCLAVLEKHPLWKVVLEEEPNLTFQISNKTHLVCQNKEVMNAIASAFQGEKEEKEICLITGALDSIERLHHSIKGSSWRSNKWCQYCQLQF